MVNKTYFEGPVAFPTENWCLLSKQCPNNRSSNNKDGIATNPISLSLIFSSHSSFWVTNRVAQLNFFSVSVTRTWISANTDTRDFFAWILTLLSSLLLVLCIRWHECYQKSNIYKNAIKFKCISKQFIWPIWTTSGKTWKKKLSAQQLNYFYVDFVYGKSTINQSDYGILISQFWHSIPQLPANHRSHIHYRILSWQYLGYKSEYCANLLLNIFILILLKLFIRVCSVPAQEEYL